MTPVVLIATHNRIEITKRNIESLLKQSVKPIIVLVCSYYESKLYDDIKDKVYLLEYADKPLGRKWQIGVDEVKNVFKESPLIITGSDDILGDGYIENALRLLNDGYDFIGLRSWWQHFKGIGYNCKYIPMQPIGGGRVYSVEILQDFRYKIFDTIKNKHLDDLGWNKVNRSMYRKLILDEPENEGLSIHAIKGDWPMLNPFRVVHKNINLVKSDFSNLVLPSFFSGLSMGENGNSFTNV